MCARSEQRHQRNMPAGRCGIREQIEVLQAVSQTWMYAFRVGGSFFQRPLKCVQFQIIYQISDIRTQH